MAVVIISPSYLESAGCRAEAQAVLHAFIPYLPVHDARYVSGKQALDLIPTASTHDLDNLFNRSLIAIHSGDPGLCQNLFLAAVRKHNPAATDDPSGGVLPTMVKQPQAFVSFREGPGPTGSSEGALAATELLKRAGYRVITSRDPQGKALSPPNLAAVLQHCQLAVIVISEAYFESAECQQEAAAVLRALIPYFPVHDAKYVSGKEALDLISVAMKYDVEEVFDRQIRVLHSKFPDQFAQSFQTAITQAQQER